MSTSRYVLLLPGPLGAGWQLSGCCSRSAAGGGAPRAVEPDLLKMRGVGSPPAALLGVGMRSCEERGVATVLPLPQGADRRRADSGGGGERRRAAGCAGVGSLLLLGPLPLGSAWPSLRFSDI